MWICFNNAFVSAVQDRNNNDRLCVRARCRAHLHQLFPEHSIVNTPDADYACRVFVSKAEFAELVSRRIADIDYPNFKNSVKERRLHDLYADFWGMHMDYQQQVTADRARHFSWGPGDLQAD